MPPFSRVDGASDLQERVLSEWSGFEGHGPVRVGNAAALQTQHDVFGEMVLALTPIFLDDRYSAERTHTVVHLIEHLARRAIAVAGSPDAGIWEYRSDPAPQTFSSVMCWAAADRMSLIAKRHAPALAGEFADAAARIQAEVIERAWNPTIGSFVGSYGGNTHDASLLQMAILRFLPSADERLVKTVAAIGKDLGGAGWLFRYRAHDGLGMPTVAFVICTFWMVEALAAIGRGEEARALFDRTRSAMSPLGLLSEDYDVEGRRMWGNFPQAYSHVGLIHAAYAASPRWADVL